MSGPKTDTSDHAAFFLTVMSHFENGKIDWEAVAADINISYGRNATAKFNKLIKTYGYEWKDGKVVAVAKCDASATAAGPSTPVKKSTKAAARKEPSSSAKKRKIQEAAIDDSGDQA